MLHNSQFFYCTLPDALFYHKMVLEFTMEPLIQKDLDVFRESENESELMHDVFLKTFSLFPSCT